MHRLCAQALRTRLRVVVPGLQPAPAAGSLKIDWSVAAVYASSTCCTGTHARSDAPIHQRTPVHVRVHGRTGTPTHAHAHARARQRAWRFGVAGGVGAAGVAGALGTAVAGAAGVAGEVGVTPQRVSTIAA